MKVKQILALLALLALGAVLYVTLRGPAAPPPSQRDAPAEAPREPAVPRMIQLSGRLHSVDGRSFAGAELNLLLYESDRAEEFSWRDRRFVAGGHRELRKLTCDQAGRFAAQFETPYAVDLLVELPGYARERQVRVDRLSGRELAVHLVREASVVGRVNRITFPSVMSVHLVSTSDPGLEDIWRLAKGDDYSFERLPAGDYRLSLGFPVGGKPKDAVWQRDIHLGQGQNSIVDFGFEHLFTLSGRALVAQLGLNAGQLYLMPRGNQSPHHVRVGDLAEDGSFRFRELAPGPYVLIAPQRPLAEQELWSTLLDHPSRVEVTLLDSDVTKLFEFPRLGTVLGVLQDRRRHRLRLAGQVPRELTAEEDGSFVFEAVPAGTYDLQWVYDGFPQRLQGGLDVTAAGAELDLGLVALDASARLFAHVEGLERLAGAPAVLALFSERDPKLAVAQRRFGDTVQQDFAGLPSGRFRPGLAFAPFNLRLETEPAVIALAANREVEVRLRLVPTTVLWVEGDAEGEGWQAVVVMDENGRNKWPCQRVDELGGPDPGLGRPLPEFVDRRALIRGLKPGAYVVQVFGDQGSVAILNATLTDQGEVSLHASFPKP